jgi:hypothetical protein
LEALKKPDIMVRLAALEILKRIADPSAYDPVERLLGDKEVNMRVAAIATATACGGTRALPRLVRMLKDSSWEVRREAVKALGRLGDGAAVEGLCGALEDHDHDVRETAAVALGKIGDPRGIHALTLSLLDDESFVRNAAYNALMDIDTNWEKTPAAQSALPEIKSALKYRGYWINQSVARLLEQTAPDAPAGKETPPPAEVSAPAPPRQRKQSRQPRSRWDCRQQLSRFSRICWATATATCGWRRRRRSARHATKARSPSSPRPCRTRMPSSAGRRNGRWPP